MTHAEAMSKMGKMWGALSGPKKKPYQDKAAVAKAKYAKTLEKYKKTAHFKKYQKEKDEFYYNKKLALQRLEPSRSKSAKKPRASVSRSKSKARKASKPKKAKSRSRSRSKSKKRSA